MKKTAKHIEKELFVILHQFLDELYSGQSKVQISPTTYLDRDLGIDSIGKVELLHRVESHFRVQLSNQTVAEVETIADLIKAIINASPQKIISEQAIVEPIGPSHVDPSTAKTLIDVLLTYVKNSPDRPHIYLQDDEGKEHEITYGKLYQEAMAGAKGLVELGLKKGETVAIMLPTSAEFFYSFFAILLAGGIPVPIYPPFRPDQIGEYAVRESVILRNAEVRFLISFHQAEMLNRLLRVFIPSLKAVLTYGDLTKLAGEEPKVSFHENDAALIQYTSGSTSTPKGVLLAHKNLLANIRAYGDAIQVNPKDICISWLPLYHDMGLIGKWFGSFYYGNPVVIMSPLSFLLRPERWLWTIHYHRGTISAGPNFAYELCVKKISEHQIEGLDLSSWRLAFNGAEAVNPKTLRRFYEKFKKYGLKEESLYPVYGLAESSVALTFPKLEAKPKYDLIQREAFEKNRQAIPASSNENTIEFVSCGSPLKDHEIRIVDTKNNELAERHIGSLQFRGPSTMQGYYRNNQATKAVFSDDWCDTGDLAYIADKEVYIVGRKKDIIIKAGRNYYPEEIEEISSQAKGVRKGCVVAFGAEDQRSGTEKLIIVAETKEKDKSLKNSICNEIRDKVTTGLGVPPDQIILVPPRSIPKTSSGKLRRSSCKADYLSGKIGKPALPSWMQISNLFIKSGLKYFQTALSTLGKYIYTLYLGMIFVVFFVPVYASIMLPSRKIARKLTRFWARLYFILTFCPLKIIGKDNLISDQPLVYAINHASYFDTMVLLAILPTNTSIVAKAELATTPILNKLIAKLGHLLVERFDFSKSIEGTQTILNKIKGGESIAIFPEGTFAYTSGLRPFKLGAFKIAAETNRPVCPISLKGTRKIMRNSIYLFRPSRIKVTINPSIKAKSKELKDISKLREAIRIEIAKHCGEEIINI